RGYDSSGIVTITPEGKFAIVKTAGRIDFLEQKLAETATPGHIGIGHTRWATHGAPNDQNAHPHLGGQQVLALAHNGVIENFRARKEQLESKGYISRTETDTEVIAHLIASCLKKQSDPNKTSQANPKKQSNGKAPAASDETDLHEPLIRAVQEALAQLRGTY